ASPSAQSATSAKARSCVTCRTRKVRCDKTSPCSNCRRAGIACAYPSAERPVRWARRMNRVANHAATTATAAQDPNAVPSPVLERVQKLEGLVTALRSQLEQANATAASMAGDASGANLPGDSTRDFDQHKADKAQCTHAGNIPDRFGRMVLHDTDQSRYVSSGFWSRIYDELDGIKVDSHEVGALDFDSSEDESSSSTPLYTRELERTPLERHAFMFGHNLNPGDTSTKDLHPLPSQVPFLFEIYSENVNSLARIIHLPTVSKMVRESRKSDTRGLTPADEALTFAIYYAVVTSMDEDEIFSNFGFAKADLSLRYRLGLEISIAKADFLNVPNLTLVQALVIFLWLARRHDSPRFVWMMTGLVIRMAQALGLHRDGTNFKHLSPYEIEMRRRVWWGVCLLDIRASEDQGTDFTIVRGSFDTKPPLNINDDDIDPTTTQTPVERDGMTDMTISLAWIDQGENSKLIMAQSGGNGLLNTDEHRRLLDQMYLRFEEGCLQHLEKSNKSEARIGVIILRLVMAKMTMLTHLPVLFASPNEDFSDTIRTKLLVSAIEIAEFNHVLNSEQAFRRWRWMYQTYTHWYAIVYLLLETSRRQWSPMVERAWVALRSPWLIPNQSQIDKNAPIWMPLRKLMAKARKHRDVELERLRINPEVAKKLEIEDNESCPPTSNGLFLNDSNVVALYRDRWCQLLM
ncbi:hypothetical protein K431DRAFT_200619, partial [Polychaeton citri CBS 116435]